MGRWVTRSWQSTYDGGLRRRDRRSGEYIAYIPDPLVGTGLALTPETEGLAAQAEARVRTVNASPDLVRIGRFLLRSEAIASSRIEGIAPSAHKIALAELGQQEEIKGLSEQARSVAHNMTLVRRAMEELSDSQPMTREHLVALHRTLVPDSPEHHGIRVVQNWLGGFLVPSAGCRLRTSASRSSPITDRRPPGIPQWCNPRTGSRTAVLHRARLGPDAMHGSRSSSKPS